MSLHAIEAWEISRQVLALSEGTSVLTDYPDSSHPIFVSLSPVCELQLG